MGDLAPICSQVAARARKLATSLLYVSGCVCVCVCYLHRRCSIRSVHTHTNHMRVTSGTVPPVPGQPCVARRAARDYGNFVFVAT
jgi:hypothetical protein